jgi:hypothetical protein
MEKYEMKAIPVLFSHIELSVDILYFLGRPTGNLHILDCCKFENSAKTYHCFKTAHVPNMYCAPLLQQPECLHPCIIPAYSFNHYLSALTPVLLLPQALRLFIVCREARAYMKAD